MIKINNLSVKYKDTFVLKDISLSISDSNIIGIIGPNGAGKSTFIKSILNLIPYSGDITINDIQAKKILNNIAYVEQKSHIDYNFPITVKECVTLGLFANIPLFKSLTSKHLEEVNKALEIVNLTEFSNRQISELSGGQFQRVLIARCLVQEADYILLDEPFVGIDSISENIIISTLKKLKNEGKTILIVHHDLSKVENYFDKIIVLNKHLITYGDVSTSFTNKNLKDAYGNSLPFDGGNKND